MSCIYAFRLHSTIRLSIDDNLNIFTPYSKTIHTRGDQKVRGKVLLNRIAFIDFNENS